MLNKEDKLYVLVDLNEKLILGKIEKLPENWRNIAGLYNLSEEKLSDLGWSGNEGCGWIEINSPKIKDYECSSENLRLQKRTFKELVSKIRKEKEGKFISYKGVRINPNEKTRYSLFVKRVLAKENPERTFSFKFLDGYTTLNSSQIIELCDIMEEHIQKCFDREREIYEKIEACEKISDFFEVNYDFEILQSQELSQ